MTIRKHGSSKFTKLIDSYAYAVGFDDEADYGEDGMYTLLRLDKTARDKIYVSTKRADEPLTKSEKIRLKNSEAVIFFEKDDGGPIEADWFDDIDLAEEEWEEIKEFSDA